LSQPLLGINGVENFYNKTNPKHQFLKFIFGIKLYMFRTVPLSIIRSFSMYTQQWYMSYRFADSLHVVYVGSFVLLISFSLLIFVIVGVAFLALLERKVLGYIHIRKGPNNLRLVDIFQPFRDTIKLFSREQ